ncbi:MAG TPA: thermonuclease family protein [Pyrinomonadaceae bacterium]|nr:thermonuclease family protein [Pyrinomonadaceae bacterium]
MKALRRALALISFTLLASLSVSASGRTLYGKVAGVTAGDTFTLTTGVNQKQEVRLFGVAAPKKGQPLHDVSRQHLSDLALGKDVAVAVKMMDEEVNLVGVLTAAGADLGAQMIRDGAAWHFAEEAPQADSDMGRLYGECEAAARNEKRGIWNEESPTPPWEFARKRAEALAGKEPQAFADSQRAEFDNAIRKSKVLMGMDPSDVERAWGFPAQRDSLNNTLGEVVIWRYSNAQVTFINGRVTEAVLLKDTPRRTRRY